jgi:excisionase family DNA binding protein
MHRHLQFDMRENPASDRRHGSRLALGTLPHSNHGEPDESAQPTLTTSDGLSVANSLDSAHAANDARYKGENIRNRLLTIQEVAHLLQVPVSWVYGRMRKRSSERLPAYRLGKYWRFRQDEVHEWVKRQCGGSGSA